MLLFVTNGIFAQINFIENKGQWESNIKYRADIPGGQLFLENGTLSYLLVEQEPFKELHDKGKYEKPVQMHYFRVVFEGANPNPTYKNALTTETYYNFYLGNNPSKWASGVNAHGKVTVEELYPGIDLEIYGATNNSLKYNLIIKPNADPSVIKMRYEGLDDLELKKGQLNLKTSLGEIKELAPICYQYGDTTLKYVKTNYSLENNVLTFDIKERYNRRKSFIIDPEIIFSTYSGALGDNWGYTGTWDNDGNAYSGGAAYSYSGVSNGSFPVTPGAFQTIFRNGVEGTGSDLARDASIYKVSSDGKTLIYATYLGGTHNEEPHSMIVNSKNQLVVFGTTFSRDFPVSSAAYDDKLNGIADIFVFVLSADGKSMIGSTFIGGDGIDGLNGDASPGGTPLAYNYGDQYRGEVIVDASDNIYVATSTQSAGDFPTKNAFQTSYGGQQDGCVFKLNPTVTNLEWSSYIGGFGYDICNGIDIDSKGNILVAGGTTMGIPSIGGAIGETKVYSGGSSDGFLIKLPPQGDKILNATYIGTSLYDQAYFVKVDNYDNPYVTGQTEGAWPATPSIFHQPNGGQFIVQYTPDLQTRMRSMTYGEGAKKPQISLSAFLVDECNRVFVSGWGGVTNSTDQGGHGGFTTSMSITDDAYQKNTDGSDFYLAVFSQNIDTILYGTFYGGIRFPQAQGEHVDGGTSRFDRRGIIYQSVCAGCGGNSLFPSTAGSHSTTNNSSNCNNAIFKIDFENLNHPPIVNDVVYTVDVDEELKFTYFGTDIDKYDTLFMDIDTAVFANQLFKSSKPIVTYQNTGLRQLNMDFSWTPNCNQVTGDTIFMKAAIKDLGCPDNKEDSATIKILVTPPPVIPPPNVLCVVPTTTTSLTLRWDNVDTSSKYFSHFIIKKIDPQGNEFEYGPFTKADKFEYTDFAVFDYRNRNYCYYIYAVNKCGEKGANSYTVCTIDQFNAPINTTSIVTATVEDNKNVKLVWFDSKEDDFDSYLIYRSLRTTTGHQGYSFYGSTNKTDDTTFIDKAVDVSKQSFCYRVQVTDQCGHISKFSNIGCNIVLQGISEPYLHKLNWDDYENWGNGVDNFKLIRWDDRKNPSQVYQGAPAVLNYNDEALDYDWGAYWYKVVATESGGNLAVSQSNEVRLIQKPLLHVPTAFTPTGDNLNDVWGLVDVFVKDYHMQVFNRWGEKVFESFDKNEQWNGSFARKGPADDVFIWLVRYTGWDNSIKIKKGTVTILN